MIKKITFTLYAIVILVMAMATIIEKTQGTPYVLGHIYGSWWFTALWALLAIGGIIYMYQRRIKRLIVILLHGSFLLILAGALLTHLTSWQGTVHLRKGEAVTYFQTEEDGENVRKRLPFTITLEHFNIRYHNGTETAADYESHFTIKTDKETERGYTSMNNIYSTHGVRLYQSGYDDDMKGTTLSLNSDPWGIPVTYTGYGLLFLSMILMLIDPKGRFRQLVRKASTTIAIVLLMPIQAHALNTFTQEQATQFGRLCINYNGRICPIQTLALDFTRKLYGKSSYNGYTAEQVLCGFIFFREEWSEEPLIRVKSAEVRQQIGLQEYTPLSSLFTPQGYILGPYLQEYYRGNSNKFHEEIAKVDDKVMLVMQLSRGTNLRIFPFKGKWYSPTDSLPATIEAERQSYFHNALTMLAVYAQNQQTAEVDEMLQKMAKYQHVYGASDMPSPTRLAAEHLYNRIPFAKVLFMMCLTFAFISLLRWKWTKRISLVVLIAAFAALTLCLALRWIISGYIPMSNGYETMILMAWIIMLASLLVYRKFRIILTFGLLLSGFLLLVSHLGQMDPKITHLMPVLSSPLLSIHVSCVMMAYGLFSIIFACGVYALIARKKMDEMHLMSQLFLFPAEFLLTAGIFLGAIWANVSWGRYWGWDPKEVWALITMLIYAIPMHSASVKWIRKPIHYHIFMVAAFLAVLITYFGVNFFLGGLHSYANQ